MNVRIPFNDLGRGISHLRSEIDGAFARVVSSGWFVLGPEHEALEAELAQYLSIDHVVNVGNGTDALELGLAALGVGQGDVVVTVANAGAYATTAIRLLGAEPVFCDVDPETLLMSADSLASTLDLLDSAPKAIVVTHLYGALAPIESIVELAHRHGIAVLEDCAQSLGARLDTRMGGTFGDIATTSFYPTKNLGALGDGGAVMTNRADLADNVKRMRQYGWKSKYNIQFAHGRNSRLDELQAAILRVKLPYLDESNQRRRDIHQAYETAITGESQLVNKSAPSFIAHLAVVNAPHREQARERLAELGIATDVHYPIPDHLQGFPDFNPRKTPLDVTEWASHRVFSVPMFPELTDTEVQHIAQSLTGI